MAILRLIILLLFVSAVSNAQSTYYVATDGDDAGAGTIGDPWLTIPYATGHISGGDTIYVRAGTYTITERIIFYGVDGTAGNRTVLSNYPNEQVIIDATGLVLSGGAFALTVYDEYVYVKGFTVRNVNMNGEGSYGGGVVFGSAAHYGHIDSCTIYDIWENGITVMGDYDTVEYCHVYNTAMSNSDNTWQDGETWGGGITSTWGGVADPVQYPIFRYDTIHDIHGEALSVNGCDYGEATGNVIYDFYAVGIYNMNAQHCTIKKNILWMSKSMGDGTSVGIGHWNEAVGHESSDNLIINNIVYGAGRNFYVYGTVPYMLVAGNTFVNSTYFACVQFNNADENDGVFKDNICVQEGALPVAYVNTTPTIDFDYNLWNKSPGSLATGSNDVIGDPLFEEEDSVGSYTWYELQSESPAINAGVAHDSLTVDFLDSTRADPPDIGVLEYYADVPAVDPTVVTTYKPYYTSPTTAIGGGNCTDDGGGTVSAKGVCWNTSENPTTANSHTDEGAGAGSFTSSITGINSTEIWHVRTYATNESGTSYGEDKTFRISYCTSGGKQIFSSDGKIITYGE